MRRLLPELIALPLLPLLMAQGRRTRARTPRLPEAAGERAGIALPGLSGGAADADNTAAEAKPAPDESRAALKLVGVGESPVAGVGVAVQEQAITAQLASLLAVRTSRPVQWRAVGRNGATVRDALDWLVEQVPPEPVDILLLAFGINDTVGFRRVGAWQQDVLALLKQLRARCAPQVVLLSGVPPMRDFPALPHPLRWVLGLKAAALDRGLQALAREQAWLHHIPILLDVRSDATLCADDGYHPSAEGCRAWARLLAEAYLGQNT